jgi:hypothetical protein
MSLRLQFLGLLALASFAVFGITISRADSVTLSWSAPADNGPIGRATGYDLRYSTRTIASSNFDQAAKAVAPLPPGTPGTRQFVTFSGLKGGLTYYFAIKSVDDCGNWSAMSNLVVWSPSTTTGVADAPGLDFSAPRPNPARESTGFELVLPDAMQVRLEVFDIGGRLVRTLLDEPRSAGTDHLAFDLRDAHGARMAQGIYLVRARLGEAVFMRRLVVTQ